MNMNYPRENHKELKLTLANGIYYPEGNSANFKFNEFTGNTGVLILIVDSDYYSTIIAGKYFIEID